MVTVNDSDINNFNNIDTQFPVCFLFNSGETARIFEATEFDDLIVLLQQFKLQQRA